MENKAEGQDDEVVVLEVDPVATEEVGEEPTEKPIEETPEATDDVLVTIGEEAPPTDEDNKAPEWVRELRKTSREDKRRIRELEEKLKGKEVETKPTTLGKRPTLEDCDYDTDKFERELTSWHDRKRETDQAAAQAEAAEKEQQKAWQAKLDAYGKAKAELKVKDFEEAEATAQDLFNITQQGIVLQGSENPALVMYALGKNPKKAQELSALKDPVKFAFAVAKLEAQLKVTPRKATTTPEKIVQGTGNKSGAVDSTLERLRAEAEKTGDYTKVIRHKSAKQAA